ncbi:MAG: YSC84-related protein [Xanthomonadales bacterium]|jgi:lipid-binding SYLF domain-containing protein|nr:YSC84-related protein [Xanthomonadales bacterium]
MKHRVITLIAASLLLTASSNCLAASLSKCQEAMKNFKALGNVSELLSQSYGYAVLPTIGKGGMGVGGAGGSGCVFAGGKHAGNVSMGQVTIGWQLGGQAYSELILFKNADTYKEFTQGNFEFGADATAVALTYGAAAGASTQGASVSAGDTKGKGAWKRGMAIFTLAKGGLMYEASIGGQKYNFKPLVD